MPLKWPPTAFLADPVWFCASPTRLGVQDWVSNLYLWHLAPIASNPCTTRFREHRIFLSPVLPRTPRDQQHPISPPKLIANSSRQRDLRSRARRSRACRGPQPGSCKNPAPEKIGNIQLFSLEILVSIAPSICRRSLLVAPFKKDLILV